MFLMFNAKFNFRIKASVKVKDEGDNVSILFRPVRELRLIYACVHV